MTVEQLEDGGEEPRTVTEFAVVEGTVEPTEDVAAAIRADRKRAEEHTQRAQQVSDAMNAGVIPPSEDDDDEDDTQG